MKTIRITISVIMLLLLWQLIVVIFNLPPYLLPAPVLVLKSFMQHGIFILQQAIPTFMEAGLGFILGVFFGITWALILIHLRFLRSWFLPLLLVSQALPVFAVAPLFVLWFGYGMVSKIAITALMLFFPITSSFYDGLRNTPRDYLDLAQIMGAKKSKMLWLIRIPAALPSFANGLRVAATFAPMGAVIGEWVGATKGLGLLIFNANSRMQIDLMFAAMLMLVLFTMVFYFLVNWLLDSFIIKTNFESRV